MKFSLIVPIYNAERHIKKCILSVLNQTFTDYELILVIDGGVDNSYNICVKHAELDDRIKVILKENGGVASARNTGIKNACGEYVVFIDSDDYVDKNLLYKINEEIKVNNSDIILYGHQVHLVYPDNDVIIKINRYKRQLFNTSVSLYYKEYLLYNGAASYVWDKAFKLSIIMDNNLTFPALSVSEDVYFVLNYLEHCATISTIPYVLYHYARFYKGNSIMQSYNPHFLRDITIAHNKRLSFIPPFNYKLKIFVVNHYLGWISSFFSNGLFHKDNNMTNAEKLTFIKKILSLKEVNQALEITDKKKLKLLFNLGRVFPKAVLHFYRGRADKAA